ncbi:MAG: hypothetical protein M3487_10715, partial [Actinomycetota bacterium]|nr:hypothetical protein [Actinomycetota bacterium]
MTATSSTDPGFGTNSWLVEEMYERFQEDPGSVGETWREFFADYRSDAPRPAAPANDNGGGAERSAPAAPPSAPTTASP